MNSEEKSALDVLIKLGFVHYDWNHCSKMLAVKIYLDDDNYVEKNCNVESDALRDELKRKLQDVEKRLRSISLPFMYGGYVQELFNAKGHVELIKSKLYQQK